MNNINTIIKINIDLKVLIFIFCEYHFTSILKNALKLTVYV